MSKKLVTEPIETEEEALLRAIAQDFDSDAPRRAYGEWLLAAGRGFGEFVLQSLVTLPAGTEGKHTKALEKLRKAHAKAWLGPILDRCVPKTAGLYHRGLPSIVAGEASDLARVVPHVLLKAPRATLSVVDLAPKHITPLLPLLTRFKGDQLLTCDFDEDAFIRLCEAGGLARFHHATLLFPLSARAFAVMAKHAPALSSLVLGMSTALGTLFASGLRLDSLHVVTDRLTDALASYDLTLSRLVATIDDFDDADVDRLLARPSARHLDWLGLHRRSETPTRLSSAGAVRLVRGIPKLRNLNLGGVFGLSAEAAAEIQALLDGGR